MLIQDPEYHYKINSILIVDDETDICHNLKAFFEDEGYKVFTASNGQAGMDLFYKTKPDLVIIDLHMPIMSGHTLLTNLSNEYPNVPKLVISGVGTVDEAIQTFDEGSWDFISKPISSFKTLTYKLKQLEEKASLLLQNKIYKEQFEQLVEKRIVTVQSPIIETQKEIVSRLGDVIEMRSRETGNHVRRVAQIAEFLALEYGLDPTEANILRMAAPLHDIGKAGIPDVILNKNGKLVDDEFEIIKTHTTIGYEMLEGSDLPIIQAAATIALQHHEHWDGSGYPHGLAGEEIHIYGRIACLADIYDVLLQKRKHKESWNRERALEYVKIHSGTFFDPDLVRLFLNNIGKISDIVQT
jgi:cyclic di-GMP phosphodiesterase